MYLSGCDFAYRVKSAFYANFTEGQMSDQKNRHTPHEFTGLGNFDKAMRKIAGTPKAEVDKRETAARKRRKAKR